jgi:hypothetical protein
LESDCRNPNSCHFGRDLKFFAGFQSFWSDFGQFGRNPVAVIEFRFTPLIFSYEPYAEKYFQENNFFLKDDSVENILRRKTFYVETNGALVFILFEVFRVMHSNILELLHC